MRCSSERANGFVRPLQWAVATCLLLLSAQPSAAFVLIGEPNAGETVQFNYTDELGWPKFIDRGADA